MDWQTVLRATVPLGAALLAVMAVVAVRRERAARDVAGAPPAADASEPPPPVEHLPRLRSAPAPNPVSLAPEPRRTSALPRALAALVLVLLLGATGLIFTTSRPLADVDIEAVTLTDPRCRGSEPCPGPLRASVRGTVAASTGRDTTVLVLVKSAHGEWSVAAEAQPDANGDWVVPEFYLPPEAGPSLEVRAVLGAPAKPTAVERDAEAGVPQARAGSRVVRAAVEAPAVQSTP